MIEEYNESECITAGELRKMGFAIPEAIPDCGWIPRSSMRLGEAKVISTDDDIALGLLKIDFSAEFLVPFKWISCDVILSKP